MKFRITQVYSNGKKMYRPERMIKFLWFTWWVNTGLYVFNSIEYAEEEIEEYKNRKLNKPKVVKEL